MTKAKPVRISNVETIRVYNAIKENIAKTQRMTADQLVTWVHKETGLLIANSTAYKVGKEAGIQFSTNNKPNKASIKYFLIELCTELCGEENELTKKAKEL